MPHDFAVAVKDIKLAILQARAKAARLANAEALKLYFFVGGYISKRLHLEEDAQRQVGVGCDRGFVESVTGRTAGVVRVLGK